MLGRVRACSLSSLEVLEMERTPSKLLKDDSLSIYEKTLLKLQQGSHRDQIIIPDESMNTDTNPSMATNESIVTVNASTDSLQSSKEEPHGNLSVLYMFSRYKTSRNGNISSSDGSSTAMETENDCSSANTSPSNDSNNSKLQLGCIVYPPSPI